MKYRWLIVLTCVLVTACAPTKDEGTKPAENEPAETASAEPSAPSPSESLLAEYDAAFDEFVEKINQAESSERAEVLKTNPTPEFAKKFRDLVGEHEGTETSALALAWLAQNSDMPEERTTSLEALLKDHFDSPAMKIGAGAIASGKPSQDAEDSLRRLMKDSPHREVRGAAAFHLVSYFDRNKSMSGNVDQLAKNPSAVNFFGEDGIEYLRNLKVDDTEIENLYEAIVSDYSDVVLSRMGRETRIGEAAEIALFEIQNLSMGCVAPNIEGRDLDGEEFSLNDYRGKVVMLDFWGDW